MNARILIVDDNVDLAENVAELLCEEGYEATLSSSPEDALRKAEQDHYDCIVLDVRMPGMDGIDLRKALSRTQPGACFVFMTAYACDERIALARQGSLGVLPKPFAPGSLIELIERCRVSKKES